MPHRSRSHPQARLVTLGLILLLAVACGGTAPGTTGGALDSATPTSSAPPATATPLATATPAATATPPPAATATLPPPTRTPVPPTATAPPAQVEARNVATTKNSSGQFVIIGELANVGAGDVGDLKVLLAVTDGAGKTVAAPTAVVAAEALAPGEKTVWQATVTEKLEAVKEVQAQGQAARLGAATRDRLYKDVKVDGVTFAARAGQQPAVWANGQLLNAGSAIATVGVWMAAYGADGKLTYVTLDSATRLYQLQPGKGQPFLIELAGITEPPARYEFFVRASKREAAFSATVIELAPQKVNVIKNAGAAPSVVGELVNPGQVDAASFTLTIAFLDDAGKIVGVGSGSLAANLLAPGERTVWRSSFFSGLTDKTAYKEVRVQAQALVASDVSKRQSARDLRVQGETIAPSGAPGSYLRVNGQLANTGTQPTQSAVIYIAIYGADGALTIVEPAFPQSAQIPAGGSSPFSINLITLKEPPAKYEFFISATKAAP